MNKNLLFIIGTRPELIKVFPIINYLKKIKYPNFSVVSTGQHKDLLESYWDVFDIQPDFELNIISKGQNLSQLTSKAILAIDKLITSFDENRKPDIIFSQGDTTTVMASSMVSFYHNIPFAHIEAGLRSFNLKHPFPEEFNRKIASIVTQYHFAPTEISKENLLNENIDTNNIHIVGNTVIDTLNHFIEGNILKDYMFKDSKLKNTLKLTSEKNIVLITCHRRENHSHLNELIEAIEILSNDNPDIIFIWPVHPNPNVKSIVQKSSLSNIQNIIITEPLEYLDLLKVMQYSKIVISDSGGIQEEAPTFKVPVLILRETTERPEAVNIGISKLVGMNKEKIIHEFYNFSPIFSENFKNPYGNGDASKKIIEAIWQ